MLSALLRPSRSGFKALGFKTLGFRVQGVGLRVLGVRVNASGTFADRTSPPTAGGLNPNTIFEGFPEGPKIIVNYAQQ